MSRYTNIIFASLALLILSVQIEAQHFLRTNGRAIVNEDQDTIILRGMGLGGWMLQEGYMLQTASFANAQYKIRNKIQELIGTEATEEFYDAWLANHVRKTDIDSLKSWGFNSVRLPMHYNLFTLPIEEEPISGENTWLNKGFELTDSLLSWCSSNEMYVILDLHAAPGGQGYDEGISDYDPSKPSLWESQQNRSKMASLWKRIAERYADEEWIAGYDLLNEPNWDLPGGSLLRNLYHQVTDSIRVVDNKHIIFIEGNWFANDFTGLTPPWDDNLVYSPHKYWSNNDEATMKWVTDIRNTYNVPLYLGESGENSNVWFRDAIRLLEDLEIGWAWWPMKKIESIAGPLSVRKSAAYQDLLDYWNGEGDPPLPVVAQATLMQLTEDLKIENCVFQKDVIDAMFRQVYSDETIPYSPHNIPGVIYAPDYDMGVIGRAYYDTEAANYQVSSGAFTSWNSGWAYRNDGVDIEISSDNINSNGYNVGFLDLDEWMQYEVEIESSGVYEIHVRTSSGSSGGKMHFEAEGTQICPSVTTPATGSWQNWETVVVPNVILDSNDTRLRFYVDKAGFNVGSFEFIKTDLNSSDLSTVFLGATTVDEHHVQVSINKPLSSSTPFSIDDFSIKADGEDVPISEVKLSTENHRVIDFTVDYFLKSTEVIKISYSGSSIKSVDGAVLDPFSLEDVRNTIMAVHQIPGKIQAEDFVAQSGIELEATTDAGGGRNIGYLDPGDYIDYLVDINSEGSYKVDFRTAAEYGTGKLQMHLIEGEDVIANIGIPDFPNTGGWQTWQTRSAFVELPKGRYILRLVISKAPFNLNWFEFSLSTSTENIIPKSEQVTIYPNPSSSSFNLNFEGYKPQILSLQLMNVHGHLMKSKQLDLQSSEHEIDLSTYSDGLYYLILHGEDGRTLTFKLVKQVR